MGVSCPSTTQCTAVDGNSEDEFTFDPSGPGSPSPTTIDSNQVVGVACPSTSQCTVLDDAGGEVTFNPNSPGSPSPSSIDTSGSSLACPSSSLCVAVDSDGDQVTFDPDSPGGAATTDIYGSNSLGTVACASSAQCVAVAGQGQTVGSPEGEGVTFDPSSPGSPSRYQVDAAGVNGVACPAASQCVAVDSLGREVQFDPSSPQGPTPEPVDSNALTAVSCPTSAQCTGVDQAGQEVTFNPSSPGSPTPVTVDAGGQLEAISCPSSSQCTAVDSDGNEATFDPMSPGTPAVVNVDAGDLESISCPSTDQCTAADITYGSGDEVTFDPNAPGDAVVATVDPDGSSDHDGLGVSLNAVSCPTTSECVSVDDYGQEITFDPASPGSATETTVDDGADDGVNVIGLSAVSCPSSSQCTATDPNQGLFTFNPESSTAPTVIGVNLQGQGVGAISCAATSRCVVTDTTTAYAFDPLSAASAVPVLNDGGALACTSSTSCVVGDSAGDEEQFNPSSPTPAPAQIDAAASLTGVSCPSSSQCTAVDATGGEVTFSPSSPGTATTDVIAPGEDLQDVACPSTTVCVAVYGGIGISDEITFNPTSPGQPTVSTLDTDAPYSITTPYVSCPTATQCTAVTASYDYTNWVTFNPSSPQAKTVGDTGIDSGYGGDIVTGLSCPSTSECVVVSEDAFENTFDPTSTSAAKPVQIWNFSGGLSCPSMTQCTAFDADWGGEGEEGVDTFDPTNPGSAPSPVTASGGGTAIDCPSTTFCVSVGGSTDAEGNPMSTSAWTTSETLAGADDLQGVDCRSTSLCVAVDRTGDAFVGTQSSTPVPVLTGAAPSISGGTAKQGQTLDESHGTWSNDPTGYSYQWEDCDGSGDNCAAIDDATGQTYTLTSADVGHTIRVQETASNAGGDSDPAFSPQTAVVESATAPPSKPVNSTRPTVSGMANVGSKLTGTTGAWSGTPPITYSYQWQRCRPGCTDIAGATASTYTLTSADAGAKLELTVTARNGTGTASASSVETGVVASAGPSAAQIKAALIKLLKPTGKHASPEAIVKARGFGFAFDAPSTGKVTLSWTGTVKGKRAVVGSANATLHKAGSAPIKLVLTGQGRKLLASAKSVKLTASATFTAGGGVPVSVSGHFTLKR